MLLVGTNKRLPDERIMNALIINTCRRISEVSDWRYVCVLNSSEFPKMTIFFISFRKVQRIRHHHFINE